MLGFQRQNTDKADLLGLQMEPDTKRHALDLCPQMVETSADGAEKVNRAGARGAGHVFIIYTPIYDVQKQNKNRNRHNDKLDQGKDRSDRNRNWKSNRSSSNGSSSNEQARTNKHDVVSNTY